VLPDLFVQLFAQSIQLIDIALGISPEGLEEQLHSKVKAKEDLVSLGKVEDAIHVMFVFG
jgi:hypothetical protein